MTSPTQRSLKYMRDQGCIAAVVEKYNQYAKVRQDLFGFIDVVAVMPGQRGVIGIQTTTASNAASRMLKVLSEPRALAWVQAGNSIQIHGWAKRGARGKAKRWTLAFFRKAVQSRTRPDAFEVFSSEGGSDGVEETSQEVTQQAAARHAEELGQAG